jgi:hypothetical protein
LVRIHGRSISWWRNDALFTNRRSILAEFTDIEKDFINQESEKMQIEMEKIATKFVSKRMDDGQDFEVTVNCVFNAVMSVSYHMIVGIYPDFMIANVYSSFRDGLDQGIAKYLMTASINPDKETMQ